MKTRLSLVALLVTPLTLPGCGPPEPTADNLRESFAQLIASIEYIRDLERDGDELSFLRPDGSGMDVSYRIHIDSAIIEPNDDESMPYRGIVESSWYLDGRLVQSTGSTSDLPMWVLDAGLGQYCWAFWEEPAKRWDW